MTSIVNLPLIVTTAILSFCPDYSKRAFGLTCKKMHALVFGNFLNESNNSTYTSDLWKHKIALLKSRETWKIKQNPKNVLELFNCLNALTFLSGGHPGGKIQSGISCFDSFTNCLQNSQVLWCTKFSGGHSILDFFQDDNDVLSLRGSIDIDDSEYSVRFCFKWITSLYNTRKRNCGITQGIFET